MDKQEEIKGILSCQAFLDEMRDMNKECLDDIQNSNPQDTNVRELAYGRIKAIESMMTRLQSAVDSDKIKDKSWTIL